MSTLEELQRSLQVQKTYLSNINQQLLKPPYQNDMMRNLKQEVSLEVAKLQDLIVVAEFQITALVVNLIFNLTSTDSK
jgi:hypothetical protein